MSSCIRLSNLSLEFKDAKILDDINLEFEENKIYGFLGKNGAGKTTVLNIIANQLLSYKGDVEVLGVNLKDDVSPLNDLCIVRESEFYNGKEGKVKDIFKGYSYFYKNYDKKLEVELCKYFNINPKKYYRKLSRGMKTIVSNIIGICSNAPITIFDEPAIGLDAENRKVFYDILLDHYIKNPRTIIISTHHIAEMENILEEIVIIDKGKLIVNDSIDNVKSKSYYLTGSKDEFRKIDCINDLRVIESFGNTETRLFYGNLDDIKNIDSLKIEVENINLQDLFVSLTKREGFLSE